MKSSTTSEFWDSYSKLPPDIGRRARTAYSLWQANPHHPSLRFKVINGVWSVRIGGGCRALGVLEGDTLYWFWIGPHDDYERILGEL